MRLVILLLLVISLKENSAQNGFVLNSIDMTDAMFDQCSYCDERSDRAGSKAVADALREYMTSNHIKILLEQGKCFEKICTIRNLSTVKHLDTSEFSYNTTYE